MSEGQEIEITDEMVNVGANVLSELSIDLAEGFASPSETAVLVYEAMQRVFLSSSKRSKE